MKTTLIAALSVCMMTLTGCSNSAGLFSSNTGAGSSAVGGAVVCPAVAYISNISIHYTSPSTLPQYLALSINGDTAAFDSCAATDGLAVDSVSIQTSGQTSGDTVQISIPLDSSAPLYGTYFSASASSPLSSTIGFTLSGRNSCTEPLVSITSQQSLTVPWQAIEPFGASCGTYGYSATVLAN